jgi:hypothetical protein
MNLIIGSTIWRAHREELLRIACEVAEQARSMSAEHLDDWYEKNVGYRPGEDEPGTDHRPTVAAMMFYHRMPEGLDTPLAERYAEMVEMNLRGAAVLALL